MLEVPVQVEGLCEVNFGFLVLEYLSEDVWCVERQPEVEVGLLGKQVGGKPGHLVQQLLHGDVQHFLFIDESLRVGWGRADVGADLVLQVLDLLGVLLEEQHSAENPVHDQALQVLVDQPDHGDLDVFLNGLLLLQLEPLLRLAHLLLLLRYLLQLLLVVRHQIYDVALSRDGLLDLRCARPALRLRHGNRLRFDARASVTGQLRRLQQRLLQQKAWMLVPFSLLRGRHGLQLDAVVGDVGALCALILHVSGLFTGLAQVLPRSRGLAPGLEKDLIEVPAQKRFSQPQPRQDYQLQQGDEVGCVDQEVVPGLLVVEAVVVGQVYENHLQQHQRDLREEVQLNKANVLALHLQEVDVVRDALLDINVRA